jgi:hypothetical protein
VGHKLKEKFGETADSEARGDMAQQASTAENTNADESPPAELERAR